MSVEWNNVRVNTDAFWKLIDTVAYAKSFDDTLMVLTDEVGRLSDEELLDFHRLVGEAHAELDNDGLYGAATALMGFVSDDVFESLRSWVILHGRGAVSRVLSDPDSLVDLSLTEEEEIGEAESLVFLAEQVHEERFGVLLTARHPELDFLLNNESSPGELPTAKELKKLYPRCSSVKRRRIPSAPIRTLMGLRRIVGL